MGQKVNPHGLRVGVIKDWDSEWRVEDCENMNFENPEKMLQTLNSHKLTFKTKIQKYSFDFSAVRQFVRTVMQKVIKRLYCLKRKVLA